MDLLMMISVTGTLTLPMNENVIDALAASINPEKNLIQPLVNTTTTMDAKLAIEAINRCPKISKKSKINYATCINKSEQAGLLALWHDPETMLKELQ